MPFGVVKDPVADAEARAEGKGDPSSEVVAKMWMAWLKWKVVPLITALIALAGLTGWLVTASTERINHLTRIEQAAEGVALTYNTAQVRYEVVGDDLQVSYRHPEIDGTGTFTKIEYWLQVYHSTPIQESQKTEVLYDGSTAEALFTIPLFSIPQWGLADPPNVRFVATYWIEDANGHLIPRSFRSQSNWIYR